MPSETPQQSTPVQFSIVTAVYNVGRFLDEFIESIERQSFPLEQVEVVAVNDGSTDDSLERLEAWAQRRPGLVRILSKENGGQSTARNAGIEVARGAWVTFTDPDDRIEPDYLEQVARFLDQHPETDMVATSRHMLDDATGEVSDTHPLRRHFVAGDKLRPLAVFGDHFHGSAPAAFFRRDRLIDAGIRFDPQVRPNFEDGHFCVRYLFECADPKVGFLKSAIYVYRKRNDSTSTLQTSLGNPHRYTSVLRHGYLDVLHTSRELYGAVPEWLQSYIVYELSWYLSSQERHSGAVTAAIGPIADEFHDLMRQILELIDADVIDSFDMRPMRPIWRTIMLHSYADEPWHAEHAWLDQLDEDQGLVRLTYRYTGEAPEETLLVRGVEVEPVHAKVRDLAYHDRVLLHERVMWVSSRHVFRLKVGGRFLDLRFEQPDAPVRTLRPFAIATNLRDSPAERARAALPPPKERNFWARAVRSSARTRLVRRRYGGAWVLLDRIHDADDSGERLFRHLHERDDINAWFVIEKGTPDWKRLRRDGYRRRVVPHGSLRWKWLMLNCRHLISSHADIPVMRPPEIVRLIDPKWRFTFLQHGVIKDDLSGWLNPKRIDLFVTSTPQEQESIAGDHTAYTLTTKETKMTGLPRFDRLLELGNRIGDDQRDLVLLAPTWRNWLVPPLAPGSQRRELREEFFESDFFTQWDGLLRDKELEAACRRHGLKVGFLPHPNLQSVLPRLQLPDHVVPLTFAGNDVQEYFARAAVLVTDYSSMAFNAAYIDRPVVYFQFDADRVLGGEHIGRGGYFEYERDGFGPVAGTLDVAVGEIVGILDAGRRPAALYQDRIEATFPQRDGKCCERITEEIIASTKPLQLGLD